MQSSKVILNVLTGAALAMITSAAVFASDAVTEHKESPASERRSDVMSKKTHDAGKRHEAERRDGTESEEQGHESEDRDEETSERHEAE